MSAYINYFKLRLITNLQYRSAAISGILTQLFFAMVYIMVFLALYESNQEINTPMELRHLVSYFWLQQAFFSLTFPIPKDQELLGMIRNGNLAYELIRPQSFYFKFFIKTLAKRLVASLLRCWPIIIVGLLLPYPYKLMLPNSIQSFILFIVSLLFGVLLVNALSLMIHIITMFTIDSRGVITIATTIIGVFDGSVIPIPFFPLWLQKIAYILPFRYITDFPYRIYSCDISIADGKILLLNSVLWIIITIGLGYLISKKALKKAVIQGG